MRFIRQGHVWAVAFAAGLAPVAGAQIGEAHDFGEEAVETIRAQFAQLDAIMFEADVETELVKDIRGANITVGEVIPGSFEYAALGPAWRKRSQMDTSRYPGMNTSIGYDGEWFWYRMHDSDTMGISIGGDDRLPGVTLLNPVFALAQWLTPDDEANDLTIGRVRDEAVQQDFTRLTEWAWSDVDGEQMVVADFEGAIMDRAEFDVRIYAREEAGQPMPVMIERVDRDGVRVRTKFSGYEPFVTDDNVILFWPTVFEFRAFDPMDGGEVGWMSMQITQLSVSEGAVQEVDFSPPIDETENVWFQEGGEFIK